MSRPGLLVSAARHLLELNRGKMRVRATRVIEDEERAFNTLRLNGDERYTYRKHIELLAEYMLSKQKEEPNAHNARP